MRLRKLVTTILVSLFLFFISVVVFVVRNVQCTIQQAVVEQGVCEQLADYFVGKSLFITDFENAPIWTELLTHQEYSQAYQYIGVRKSLSGQVTLYLVSKKPDYRLVIGEQRFLLNQHNKLRNDQSSLTIPTIQVHAISYDDLQNQGYLHQEWHQKFLGLARALEAQQFSTAMVDWLSDQEIQLHVADLLILLDTEKDFSWQIERLKAIFEDEALKETLQTGNQLDLRFNLPVLK